MVDGVCDENQQSTLRRAVGIDAQMLVDERKSALRCRMRPNTASGVPSG
jgi:hypothetical protein